MVTDQMEGRADQSFPVSAGTLFGLGLGGFFDGIVLHQLLQWHHMLTDAGYPPTSVENLKLNTLWDGLFHATTYVFVVLGLLVLWRASRRSHIRWSSKLLVGSLLSCSQSSPWAAGRGFQHVPEVGSGWRSSWRAADVETAVEQALMRGLATA